MSTLYLIRHSQAGSRDNYDQLSDLGQLQSELLGGYLAERKISFDAIYAGSLHRHQQTAHIVTDHLLKTGREAPEIVTDPRWNEFRLASVYQALAPRMIAGSARFADYYQEMQAALIIDPHTTRGAAGWCDRVVIKAWMENRYPDYDGDSWEGFRSVALSSFEDLVNHGSNKTIAIFTSTTPIAIWVGSAFALANEKILRLMAVIYNSSITTIKMRQREPLVITFNTTPHLTDDSLMTFR